MRQPLCWMDMAICREKDMAVGIYVLHLHSCEEETRQSFLREALECVDPVRRNKTERLKGTGAKAASLGAGMLLQKIAMDLTEGIENTDILFLEEDELLAVLQARMLREQTPPFSFSYKYGGQGKPQIVNFPKKFNLSHSGDYVVCGVSDGEVGVDIQKWVPFKDRTAERFFAKEEWKLLQETGVEKRTELFYRLWSRKEAYGKYTGQGIGSVVGEDFSDERRWKEKKICFREQILEAGYSLAVCYGTAEVLNSRKTGNSKT